MPESLVGRIVHASHDGRDLSNMFCLIVEDGPTTVTLLSVLTEITWEDDCSGSQRPIRGGDAPAVLPECPMRVTATKDVDSQGNPIFREGILTYRLWDGRDVPCRYL